MSRAKITNRERAGLLDILRLAQCEPTKYDNFCSFEPEERLSHSELQRLIDKLNKLGFESQSQKGGVKHVANQ